MVATAGFLSAFKAVMGWWLRVSGCQRGDLRVRLLI